tara:strand:+ start:226 stop:504 length:279 start_codon:yes stop_codon:yes gene_type:complete
MDTKEKVRYLIAELKQQKFFDELYKRNHIEFDNYFKYSGEVEETKALISKWRYNHNNRCNDIHEQFIKVERIRNLKKPKDNEENNNLFKDEE